VGNAASTGEKKVNGRKRQILVDTLGLLVVVVVTGAGLSDPAGAQLVLTRATWNLARLRHIWADSADGGQLTGWVAQQCFWVLEVVRRIAGLLGFHLVPRRWVVERTFAWFGKYRRLRKDYEYHSATSEAMIYVAMIQLMLKRLC
jgi:putative transposase